MISERIREYAQNQGVSKYKLSKLLNVSTSFFDKKRNNVSGEILQRMLELYPTIDLYHLVTGVSENEFLRNKLQQSQQVKNQ
ncbi:MAG: hypothetical protein LBS50_08630 [Prevotellaceae bacterium]|jgi:hypothetical protein|nr:hypothetical protein [Prevotellaceae bacterium]